MAFEHLIDVEIQTADGSKFLTSSDGVNSVEFFRSSGSPEAAIAAPPGSVCLDYSNGDAYVKNSGVGNTGWVIFSTGTGITNLSLANVTGTSYDILSDTGVDVTLPSANATDAGLMPAADKVKSDFITVTQAVDLDDMEGDIVNLQTLSGVADGSVDLGTFTGTTVADASTVKSAIQALETSLEGVTLLPNAQILVGDAGGSAQPVAMTGDVSISNAGVTTVVSASDTVAGKVELATSAEALAGTSTVLAVTPDALDSYITSLAGNVTGVADLGTFSGSTVSDNVSIKTALQELETFTESIVGGLVFAGTWDATTADPSASLDPNEFYRVSVAGTTSVTTVNKGAVTLWNVGDYLLKDNSGNVHMLDNTDPVLALNTIVHATLNVSNGGSQVTLPAAVASASLDASDGTAGVMSGDDKFVTSNTKGFTSLYGDGAATSYNVSHNLGSTNVQVQVIRVSDGETVFPQVVRSDSNTVAITHAIAPASNAFRVVVSRTAVA